ncbi:MAG: DUF4115 domain-containing protein [Xanthomonadaceae bacterium]|nr:DUF4115 domain-containing protein [Xanthomonadaceae bacterium]
MIDIDNSDHVACCPEGLGERLRKARENAGLTAHELAARMHVLVRIVNDIEHDRFDRLGADVYVRGHIKSYAREVGMPLSEIESFICRKPAEVAPEMICVTPRPRWQASLEALAHRSVYIVLTVAIVAPIVWLAGNHRLSVADQPLALLDAPAGPGVNSLAVAGVVDGAVRAPVIAPASLTPRLPPAEPEQDAPSSTKPNRADAEEGQWQFVFTGDSWFELYDRDGNRLIHELVRAGTDLRFPVARIGRVALGNASDVEVLSGASKIDIERFQQGNVARFAVSSDGEAVARTSGG